MTKLSRLLAEICRYDPDFYEESFEPDAEKVLKLLEKENDQSNI